jgi:hypothetical protein
MKASKVITLGFCIGVCVTFGLLQNTIEAQNATKSQVESSVTITIDKNTTDSDFEGISQMLSEYNIEAVFKNIKRNSANEITSISIKLSSQNGQQSQTNLMSNTPINTITFGSKNGQLYIKQGKSDFDIFGFMNQNNSFSFPFDTDSLMSQSMQSLKSFNFQDFFDDDGAYFFNTDSLDINALKAKFLKKFNLDEDGGLSYLFNDKDQNQSKSQTYYFKDAPDQDKLIVIDGEISDFKTLDQLSKENKLNKVDILKPETAMSIYGDKAKDGAVIVTTKK